MRRSHGRRRRRKRGAAERRHIAAERQLDHQRVVAAAVRVIACERAAQPCRLDTHDRVGLRIEILRPPERLDRDGVALDAILRAAQPRLDDVAQERHELRRSAERLACRHMLQRGAYLVRVRTVPQLHLHRRHCPAASPGTPRIT
jgi:hypothetical protein